tara:strand:+ start:11333 stop:12283 length:951 start_codon:yes stop_codon:yes gene_type:complete
MIVLITGSSGFIGFHLSNFFLKRGYKVLGLDNHNGYYSKRIKNKRLLFLKKNKNFNFFKTNIADPVKLEKIFYNYNPDVVYHLSGQPGVLYSLKNPKIYKINNFIATKNICKLCKKYEIKKFFFASSSSIYGDQKIFPIKESSKPFPKNPYARTKLNSEKVIQKIFKKTKIRYLIFRFFTVYGPLGRPDMFIHKFLKGIEKNKTISLFNNGLNFRDFTYVDDVVKILFLFLKKNTNKKIINICRSKPIRTIELVNILKKNCNKKNIKIKMTGFVKGEMLKTHGSNKKLKKYIGNMKFTDLKKGINKTVKAYNLFGI